MRLTTRTVEAIARVVGGLADIAKDPDMTVGDKLQVFWALRVAATMPDDPRTPPNTNPDEVPREP